MSVTEDLTAAASEHAPAKQADNVPTVTSDAAPSEVPEAASPRSTTAPAAGSPNPFDDDAQLHTPSLPPRPDDNTMATTTTAPSTAPAATDGAHATEEVPLSPQVEALRAMFPDFDVAVLYVAPCPPLLRERRGPLCGGPHA